MVLQKKIIALLLGATLGLLFLSLPVSQIIATGNQHFTLFDLTAPTLGAFIGSGWGAATVIIVKLVHAFSTNQALDTITIIRLFPLAMAALYFGARRSKFIIALIPLICMALFIMHPEGRQAWYYALYWLIPVVAIFAKRSLVLNSLGATFTAHAIGGVTFLYALNLSAEVWIALIPIVFIERMIFTAGTAVSYVALNSLANWLHVKLHVPMPARLIQPEYTFSRALLKNL
ncbi:MAG: hypothetical protein HZC01_04815 [Candidatus Kerfeldbacteria bacterium]|nr:hypothetical protein [Candidatus Kerfeldbacteria bacterium]